MLNLQLDSVPELSDNMKLSYGQALRVHLHIVHTLHSSLGTGYILTRYGEHVYTIQMAKTD